MKLFLFLMFVRLCCPNYYTADTEAVPLPGYGTLYDVNIDGDVHIFSTYDIYSGSVTLVMNSNGTEDVTDDEIVAVIERS